MSTKKIVSITVDETLLADLDQRVEETHAKSRSAFVARIIKNHLSGQVVSLSDEEFEALQVLAEAMHKTPSEIIRFVVNHMATGGKKVKEKLDQLPVMPPVIPTD